MDFDFEIRKKDAAARLGRLDIGGKTMETPALFPVYNPFKQTISMGELVDEFDPKAIMTNAYGLYREPDVRKRVVDEGIHDFLDYDGIVATDSGSYQLMVYGSVDISNKQILDFESDIGTEIGSFLDIPSHPDAFIPRAKKQLEETIERSKEAENVDFIVNAGLQGAKYPKLRAESALAMGKRFRLLAVGGIVPLMESYRFAELVDVIMACKTNLPHDRVVHAFGLGHPMLFPLAALAGCDLFDSAAYALYAQADRYMTEYGTERIQQLEYVNCRCPVCTEHGAGIKELYGSDRVKAIARHNLHVSFSMIERVRQAIASGRLWELAAMHARCHPKMMQALERVLEYSGWISCLEPVTKPRMLCHTGFETEKRPDVLNARARLERVKATSYVDLHPFGRVADELLDMYPFNGVYSMQDEPAPKVRDIRKLRAIMDYQFGSGASDLLPDDIRIKRSKRTSRIRWVYLKHEMIASVRAHDHFIIPHPWLAQRLHEFFDPPRLRLRLVDDDLVVAAVEDGKSAMCKFVKDVDPYLRAKDECLIVAHDDRLISAATLTLSPQEIMDFKRGMAARTR